MWTHVLEGMRWAVLVLGVVNLGWLLIRVSTHWESYPSAIERGLSITLILFVLSAAYASAEGIIQDIPVGNRSVIIVAAQASLTFLLWASRGRTLFDLEGKRAKK